MQLDLKKYKNRHSLKSKMLRYIWGIVWFVLFRPTPKIGFNRWRILLLRCFGARIGKNCVIHPSAKFWLPSNLEIGNWVAISERSFLYSVDKITIGDSVTISQEVFLCCASHDISSPIMELIYKPITINDQAWIASRAFISPGISIGEGAVVAACSVVTKNVSGWTVVAGNPARPIKNRVLT